MYNNPPDSVVVFDLDSTLADTRPRRHLSPFIDPNSDWDIYSNACENDLPLPGGLALLNLLSKMHIVHILTGRRETSLYKTETWLINQGASYGELRMRRPTDPISNSDFKVEYIRSLLEDGFVVSLFVSDWKGECNAVWESLQVPSLCVNPGYDDESTSGWDNFLSTGVHKL